eukprot:CAMPEP_0180656418 /NCGR_PEP_ID=MMETSP1037_2-20121125/55844_1 /TAXON_ID=632150 /ORGANISM="Azadinium spinosum, Strain 3D9" /LENGTH=126 /DNA_ID=CAMNT_0022683005 /DNA_START=250 /DNA_END=627 /DNA_ORIENTATION=+
MKFCKFRSPLLKGIGVLFAFFGKSFRLGMEFSGRSSTSFSFSSESITAIMISGKFLVMPASLCHSGFIAFDGPHQSAVTSRKTWASFSITNSLKESAVITESPGTCGSLSPLGRAADFVLGLWQTR